MKLLSKITLTFCLIAIFIGCRKGDTFEDTPVLKYESYEFVEDSDNGRDSYLLTVFFTDGDGDIGVIDEDSSDPCDEAVYNFLVRYFERINDTYQEVFPLDSCLPFHNIIADITPEGQNKTLEGDIIATFPYSGLPQNASTDSIKFEFVLIDRSGKRSLPETSASIPVR